MITLFKQRKAFQISTISPALPYALFDRSISHAAYEQQENGKIVFDGIVALARQTSPRACRSVSVQTSAARTSHITTCGASCTISSNTAA